MAWSDDRTFRAPLRLLIILRLRREFTDSSCASMSPLTLEPVQLPAHCRRDPSLPVFKKVAAGQVHPLRVPCFGKEQSARNATASTDFKKLPHDAVTYVYAFEECKEKAKSRHTSSKDYQLPNPFAEGLIAAGALPRCFILTTPKLTVTFYLGFIQLRPGDAVFARPTGGNEDGSDDVLQVLVLAE